MLQIKKFYKIVPCLRTSKFTRLDTDPGYLCFNLFNFPIPVSYIGSPNLAGELEVPRKIQVSATIINNVAPQTEQFPRSKVFKRLTEHMYKRKPDGSYFGISILTLCRK